MSLIKLDENELIRLKKIKGIPTDKEQQEAWTKFWDYLYPKYKLDKKRFYTINQNGTLKKDERRVRTEEVKKISKSDQTETIVEIRD